MQENITTPILLKAMLTIREAAEYSNIGINKIDSLIKCPIVRLCFGWATRN